MTYIQFINGLVLDALEARSDVVVFGQNVTEGSCLSGLTRGIRNLSDCIFYNTQNSEYSLLGMGMGMMLNNRSSVFFMKQMDFSLLGVDHFVNTLNVAKTRDLDASFTLFTSIVDSGYEGPQASFNAFYELCAIARIEGYILTDAADSEFVLREKMFQPGFRIIALSQHLSRMELGDNSRGEVLLNGGVVRYGSGADVAIVSFNTSFSYTSEISESLASNGVTVDSYAICSVELCLQHFSEELSSYKKVIVIDDSKGGAKHYWELMYRLSDQGISARSFQRAYHVEELYPNKDRVVFDIQEISDFVNASGI